MTPAEADDLMRHALELQARADPRAALELYADLFQHYPNHPEVLQNAGLANLSIGRVGAAEQLLLRALELRPQAPTVRSILIKLWVRMERAQILAEVAADRTWLALLDFDASRLLGESLSDQGHHALARGAWSRAVDLQPTDAGARHKLGSLLLRLNAAEEAEPHLRAALQAAPSDASVHVDLARCLFAMHLRSKRKDRWSEGRRLIEAALQLSPTTAYLHHEMGLIDEQEGRFAEAKAAYRQALALRPRYAAALTSLAAVSRGEASDSLLEELQAAAEALPAAQVAEKSRAYQALGKCFDARGEFDRAFSYFEKANEVLARERIYDREARRRYVDNLIGTYSRDAVEAAWPVRSGEDRPVFIVGMPRSGTTLLEHMLARHPDVEGAGEIPYFTMLERAGRALHDPAGQRSPHWQERLTLAYRNELRAQFDSILSDAGAQARFVTDKMPFNFAQLGMITCLYPGAKIIHCTRDASDIGLSCFIETFGDTHDWSFRLADIGHYYRQYQRLMSHWSSLFGARMFELRYRDLIEQPEATLRSVFDFLGLEWRDEWASYARQSRSIRTPSNWQVRQPLYTSSLGRAAHYRAHLGALCDALKD